MLITVCLADTYRPLFPERKSELLDLTVNSYSFLKKKNKSEKFFGNKFGYLVPNFDKIFEIQWITNNHVSSNKGFLEDGPFDGANPTMRHRKNDQRKEKRLSYAEAHREEFERPKSQIRKVF